MTADKRPPPRIWIEYGDDIEDFITDDPTSGKEYGLPEYVHVPEGSTVVVLSAEEVSQLKWWMIETDTTDVANRTMKQIMQRRLANGGTDE